MCVINFNIVTVGSSPIGAEGRYRPQGLAGDNWEIFPINLADMKTPDIIVNGQYHLQVRVQYPDLTYSDWTPSTLIKVGSCLQQGNLYTKVEEGENPCDVIVEDFTEIFFTNSPQSGTSCYVPALGEFLYQDSDLSTPVDPGNYVTYGYFAGCISDIRIVATDVKGMVNSVFSCNS